MSDNRPEMTDNGLAANGCHPRPPCSATCTDGDLLSVAAHGLHCALSWEPSVRIIGNCRAADLRKIFAEYIALKSPNTEAHGRDSVPVTPIVSRLEKP